MSRVPTTTCTHEHRSFLQVTDTFSTLIVAMVSRVYAYVQTHHDVYRRTSFYCTLQILCFLQIEDLWQPHVEQVYWHHFSNSICSLHVSVSHFDNLHNTSNFFIIIIFVIVICDQWSLMILLQLTEGLDNG